MEKIPQRLGTNEINAKIVLLKGLQPLQVELIDVKRDNIIYQVSGTPICQYDQHSRARIGIKFFEYEVSEEATYILYTNVFDTLMQNIELQEKVHFTLDELEHIRNMNSFKTPFNLMSRACTYKVKQDFSSLKGQMARRLKFCEEEFIVGLHWVLRDKLIKFGQQFRDPTFVKEMESLLPGCDKNHECDYASADYLSNMFGCLFAGCGRWESHAKYASFNQSCTTPELVEQQTGIIIPRSTHEIGQITAE